MKKKIRLTESSLHKIIKECVKRIINEDAQFDAYFERELQMPYEMRRSQMTDEEIIGMLNAHKKRDMEYDFQQEQERKMRMTHVPDTFANNNVLDNDGTFSERGSFIRGDYK